MHRIICAAAIGIIFAVQVDAATLQVFSNASASTLDTGAPAGSSGQLGGTDTDTISTNTAGSSAVGTVNSTMSTPVGSASAFASADIQSGQVKASVSANGGTQYSNLTSQRYWFSQAGASASALISETFTAVGSGTATFSLAFDGDWSVAGQPYVSCCNPGNVTISGSYNPTYILSVGLTLGGNGVLDGSYFSSVSPSGPSTGSVNSVLTAAGTLFDGGTYGISAALDLGLFDAIGFFDFASTATLSYTTSPGLTLLFDDQRFLTSSPVDPAPVPLPAGAALLGSVLFGLGAVAAVRKQR